MHRIYKELGLPGSNSKTIKIERKAKTNVQTKRLGKSENE